MAEHITKIQIAYLVIVAICAVLIPLGAWKMSQTNHKLQHEVDRVTILSQRFCTRFNEGRIDSNETIRLPLRQSLFAIYKILNQAAARNPDPKEKANTRYLAIQFLKYGNDVKLAQSVNCDFLTK